MSNNQTERESSSLGPAPRNGSLIERQIWAFRRYYGISSGGQVIEEWTQQEIADALGVSRQTVDRWLNRETIAEPIVGGLSRGQRLLLYGMIVGERTDKAEEYLTLLDLEGKLDRTTITSQRREESDSRNSSAGGPQISSEQSAGPDSEIPPFEELSEDFDPWSVSDP
jgi:transcriptional regulator with XRE-family HTH domain